MLKNNTANGEEKFLGIILAAGKGTRMKSALPKVLHPLLGEAMIEYVITALAGCGVDQVVAILGHGSDLIERALEERVKYAYQKEQLGTGHALMMALPVIKELGGGQCLVVCGDTPLLTGKTLVELRQIHQTTGAKATVLTADLEDPTGYGRIVKNGTQVLGIVEEKDCTLEQRQIKEVNAGSYCFDLMWLDKALSSLTPANAQGEYYLTDVIAYLAAAGQVVTSYKVKNPQEIWGINDRRQLAQAEEVLRRQILDEHMLAGVSIGDVSSIFIGPKVEIAQDTVIDTGCQIFGNTKIESNCQIGPRSLIKDCIIGKGTKVNQSTMEGCRLGEDCVIGPYSYMRPGCQLANQVKVGAFVEMKKVLAENEAKIPHLSYVGDCHIGKKANVGAGTITCNYDGENKFPTIIEAGAFVGSNTNLVAPVKVGERAYTAAGSTITEDVPAGALAIARSKQVNINNWQKGRHK